MCDLFIDIIIVRSLNQLVLHLIGIRSNILVMIIFIMFNLVN